MCTGQETGSDIVLKSVNINPDKKLTGTVRDNLCRRVKSIGKHSKDISEQDMVGLLSEHSRLIVQ